MESQLTVIGLVVFVLFIFFVGRTPKEALGQEGRGLPDDENCGKSHHSAKVIHAIDGDTAIITIGWQEVTLRLHGIDCPKNDQR
jgi:endonuclease YncB( thermonuclease family)